ncbi:unnamed protein product [Arabis nemorensis]|uniref:Uncharacterized protein n=1 Tax=Arabis nemorensis TaxID=586526 RepID=A0A565BMR5_9BRAS|nr:unnamed protein product [Arabis nemorensis]
MFDTAPRNNLLLLANMFYSFPDAFENIRSFGFASLSATLSLLRGEHTGLQTVRGYFLLHGSIAVKASPEVFRQFHIFASFGIVQAAGFPTHWARRVIRSYRVVHFSPFPGDREAFDLYIIEHRYI